MKYSFLFCIFVSSISGFSYGSWASCFTAARQAFRSARTKINSFQQPFKQTQSAFYIGKNRFSQFAVASSILGVSAANRSYCQEQGTTNMFLGKEIYRKEAERPRGALHEAARTGQLQTLQNLVASGGDVWQRDERGYLPLHHAIESGQADIVSFLLALDNEEKEMVDGLGDMFHQVIEQKMYRVLDMLLEHGVDTDQCGLTQGDWDVLRHAALYHGREIDLQHLKGLTPLERAVRADDLHIVKALLGYGASYQPEHMLTLAACRAKNHVFKLLFEHSHNNLSTDVAIDDLLIHAAKGGSLGIVCFLYKRGAHIDGGESETSPLIEASAHGHADIVRFLCDNGADLDKKDMGVVGALTALQKARSAGHTEIVTLLLDKGATPEPFGVGLGRICKTVFVFFAAALSL